MPIVFAWDDADLYSPIDRKPKSVQDWHDLRRVRNIETNGRASVVVDEYAEDWTRLVWVRLDGTAEILTAGPARNRGRKLLEAIWLYYNLVDFAVTQHDSKAGVAIRLAFDEAEGYAGARPAAADPARMREPLGRIARILSELIETSSTSPRRGPCI